MKCDIICYAVPTDNYANSPARGCVKCNTHGMVDWTSAFAVGDLYPVGKIEQAVDDGLAKIAADMAENNGKTDVR